MEQRRYRVCYSSDGGTASNLAFEGNEYELKTRFPVENYPEPIYELRQENPSHEVTFYFKLLSSTDGKNWTIETVDPRLK